MALQKQSLLTFVVAARLLAACDAVQTNSRSPAPFDEAAGTVDGTLEATGGPVHLDGNVLSVATTMRVGASTIAAFSARVGGKAQTIYACISRCTATAPKTKVTLDGRAVGALPLHPGQALTAVGHLVNASNGQHLAASSLALRTAAPAPATPPTGGLGAFEPALLVGDWSVFPRGDENIDPACRDVKRVTYDGAGNASLYVGGTQDNNRVAGRYELGGTHLTVTRSDTGAVAVALSGEISSAGANGLIENFAVHNACGGAVLGFVQFLGFMP